MRSARRILFIGAVVLLAVAPAAAAGQKPETPSGKPQTAASAAVETGAASITYRKIFKSSSPEFVEIKLNQDGSGTYDIRQLDDPPKPLPFHASPAVTAKVFSLAATLHDFQGVQLEARRSIANLGRKTFRYDKGAESYQVSFNFTLNSNANKLLGIFEGLSLQDQYVDDLRSAMRYDPLGLNDVLLRLERDLAAKSLPDPVSLLPILNEITSNRSLLDIARDRAREIAESISHRR